MKHIGKVNRVLTSFQPYIFLVLVCISSFAGEARSEQVPSRVDAVVAYLKTQSFATILPGFSAFRTTNAAGVGLIALRISPDMFNFKLLKQVTDNGDWVAEAGQRENAIVAFNGGFFGINNAGKKFPVGLLKIDGVEYSQAWRKSGGYLIFGDNGPQILPTSNKSMLNVPSILQSKPNLIEPGGKWAMNTNQGFSEKRTLICNDVNGNTIVVIVFAGGLSLYEAGWLMREESVGGYFNCDTALAMDGGGSTQIWVKDHPELSFAGETPVQNLIAVYSR